MHLMVGYVLLNKVVQVPPSNLTVNVGNDESCLYIVTLFIRIDRVPNSIKLVGCLINLKSVVSFLKGLCMK